MTKIKLLILSFLILGCSKNQDPLNNVGFGVTDMNSFLDKIPVNLIKAKPKRTFSESSKESRYEYYIPYKDSTLKYNLILNPDVYDFGKVRHLKITIPEEGLSFFMDNSDSLIIKLKREVLFNKLMEYHGKPDTINIKTSYSFSKYDSNKKYLIWKNSNYSIRIEPPSSLSNYDATEVFYEMNDLEKELEKIKDSVTKNQTINSLIQPLNINCYWKDINRYTKEFYIPMPSIVRKDTYDEREINVIRFDLEIQDEFKKTLYEVSELTFKIEPALHRKDYEYSFVTLYQSPPSLMTQYDIRNSSFFDLEKARNYGKNNKLNYLLKNVQLVLSDGTVIK